MGFGAYLVLSGLRAGLSYTSGVVIAGLAFTAGIAAVRWADRITPALSMVAALLSYATIAIAFAAILARSDPKVVDGPAFAIGLVVAVILWMIEQFRMARPRNGR